MVTELKYKLSNEKIKMIVEELGEEYKDLIITKALLESNKIDVDDIVASELVRVDVKIKSSFEIDEKEYRRRRVNALFSFVGILYAIMGLFLLMYKELDSLMIDNPTTMIAILSIFIGVFISMSSILFKLYPKRKYTNRYNNSKAYLYEIISKWKELEALIVQLTPEEKQSTLKEMINYLLETNIIDSNDKEQIMEILNFRNRIVHYPEENIDFSMERVKNILRKTDDVIHKLMKIV